MLNAYHPHLGEIDQVIFRVVGGPLFNKGQVSKVHSQIWHTGRVTTRNGRRKRFDSHFTITHWFITAGNRHVNLLFQGLSEVLEPSFR